ncbi:toxin [Candidatus Woesebacteria bacterium]|nr:toxin [Candidatus Woesebacteria bacterium]
MLKYIWDQQKNELLISTRGICFHDVLEQINKKEVLGDLPHHNPVKYPNQRLYILRINNYVCIVPYVRVKNTITFKTIYKSRKLNKQFKEQYDKTKK